MDLRNSSGIVYCAPRARARSRNDETQMTRLPKLSTAVLALALLLPQGARSDESPKLVLLIAVDHTLGDWIKRERPETRVFSVGRF